MLPPAKKSNYICCSSSTAATSFANKYNCYHYLGGSGRQFPVSVGRRSIIANNDTISRRPQLPCPVQPLTSTSAISCSRWQEEDKRSRNEERQRRLVLCVIDRALKIVNDSNTGIYPNDAAATSMLDDVGSP